ncbi:MAG: lytic transglycosylase domain-containing protein [Anaeromyxobacter sp.]|nr:lytic transglycosylase domain-containing protein [Anaeromyxobacter sp.]MBL0276504.1 lytic transglycosylase domain-containing protein [Anaeromyxobacter sp.]
MTSLRHTPCLALLALLAASPARGDDTCSYVDGDGVNVFTNVPTDPRCKRVRTSDVAGVYRSSRATKVGAATRTTRELYKPHIRDAAEKYQLPEALIMAVMAVESNFNPRALSDKGAMGLMQLMPGTARDLFVTDAYDPAQNIEGGARYLRLLANQYAGDLVKTLAAYNAGPEAVRRAGEGVPNIPETREYVRKVVALYETLKAGR